MKTYKVTSPYMRGAPVKALQRRLRGANVFKENYHPGDGDGIYGEETANAAKRAKFWLGYPNKLLIRTYGNTIDNYLSGKVKLPDDYKKRRAERKKAAASKTIGEKALEEARKHIGVAESPRGSNNVMFSRWYGIIGPWCAMFVTYCFDTHGSAAFIRGTRYSYVPYILADAQRGINHLSTTRNPKPGDLVIFDWNRNGSPDHVGIYEKALSDGFQTIEGNTGSSNFSNGGEVMRCKRNRSMAIIHFVRVAK